MGWHKGMATVSWLVVTLVAIGLTACDTGTPDAGGPATAKQDVETGSRQQSVNQSTAGAVSDMTPQRAVVSETLPYAEVDEQLVRGYFVFPADMVDPLPAIIVIHEWWGLNDDVRAMADRLAGEGYIVLAVDLFGGAVAGSIDDARKRMVQVLENPENANSNIRQAYGWLETTAGAPRIGSLGWSFGGAWSLNTALLFPDELDAAVVYYGQLTDDAARLEPLNVPILGLFGAKDRGVTVESVNSFAATMKNLGKNFEMEIYPNVGHAFAIPAGNNYDPATAEAAWTRAVNFLKFHLSIALDRKT